MTPVSRADQAANTDRSLLTLGVMTDTPKHIKDLQLKIWLSKSPMERLKHTLEDNGALLQFWSSTHVVNADTLKANSYNRSSMESNQISH